MNFCNNFVSVHQFTTATKVVGLGCIQQSAALVPVTNNQQHHHNLNICNFPNNIQVSNAIQHNYHNSTPKLLTPKLHFANKPYSVGSKTLWLDSVINRGDLMEVTLPNMSSQTQDSVHNPTINRISNGQSQTVLKTSEETQTIKKKTSTVLVHHVSTMTDFNQVETYNNITTRKDSSEDDNSKSSLEEDQSLQKFSSYSLCSNIHLKSNTAAMTQYLNRLQSPITHEIKEFLKNHSVYIEPRKLKNINDNNTLRGRPESQLSSVVEESVLHCCTECKITFPQKEEIEQNITAQKPERKYECNVCGLCLKRKEHLDQHKRGHSEVRPFVCDICNKGFKRNEHLRRHIVIHSGNKGHLCIHCGKAFSRKDHLNKHLLTHVNKQIKSESDESQPVSPSL